MQVLLPSLWDEQDEQRDEHSRMNSSDEQTSDEQDEQDEQFPGMNKLFIPDGGQPESLGMNMFIPELG